MGGLFHRRTAAGALPEVWFGGACLGLSKSRTIGPCACLNGCLQSTQCRGCSVRFCREKHSSLLFRYPEYIGGLWLELDYLSLAGLVGGSRSAGRLDLFVDVAFGFVERIPPSRSSAIHLARSLISRWIDAVARLNCEPGSFQHPATVRVCLTSWSGCLLEPAAFGFCARGKPVSWTKKSA